MQNKKNSCYTKGVKRLLEALKPYSRPKRTYPSDYQPERIKRNGVHSWIRAIFEKYKARCLVEENMVVCADLEFKSQTVTYINVQAVITEGAIEDFIRDDSLNHSYFRLDYHPTSCGMLLREPHPHIHTTTCGEPRFDSFDKSGYVVMAFFDFIYRNYFYNDWLEWAEGAYYSNETVKHAKEELDCFKVMTEAFRSSKMDVFEKDKFAKALSILKQSCLKKRNKMFPYAIDTEQSKVFRFDN